MRFTAIRIHCRPLLTAVALMLASRCAAQDLPVLEGETWGVDAPSTECSDTADCHASCSSGDMSYQLRVSLETLPRFIFEEPAVCGSPLNGTAADENVRTDVVVSSTYVATGMDSERLLPAPNDGNDLFYSQFDYSNERLPDGTRPLIYSYFLGADGASKDLVTRFKALPSFGLYFDTGFVGGTFDVEKIALGKSSQAGQTTFLGDNTLTPVPISLLLDNQILNSALLGGNQLQVYVEANNHQNAKDFRLPHLYARVYDLDRITIGAGKTYSLFGVGGALPSTISQSSTLIGTGELDDRDKVKQIRLQVNPNLGGWGWGLAVEEPYAEDFTKFSGTKLTRWPNFSANLAFNGRDGVDRLQISGLVRSLGFEANGGEEFFETGWALSTYAMIGTLLSEQELQGFFAGIAGGDGVGHYVQGVSDSAVFNGTQLRLVQGVGAYAGMKRQWKTASFKDIGMNLAYGYASVDREFGLDGGTNRVLQQAWANTLYYPSQNLAIGVEYQFGRRDTIDNRVGENHRVLFMLALTTSPSNKENARYLVDSDSNRSTQPTSNLASRQRL
ncbi:MAG: hypothetical protein KDB23_23100 [Planctomycetales bacterium]|nr:hypothetical protein [Planctomycetales bacterium]